MAAGKGRLAVDEDRRELLKKGALGGALVWATPSVATLSRAAGQTATPAPPGECDCRASAFGLRVVIPALGIDQTLGVGGCVAEAGVTVGAVGTATVKAKAVCGNTSTSGTSCSASASIAELDVVVGPALLPTLTVSATVLTSSASGSCDPCATTGTSSLASLKVNNIAVNVTGACNLDALNLGLVKVNEQTCSGGTLSVNALHVNVAGIVEVIAAHSQAAAAGCPCIACS